ncbi:MAG: hypothetical protein RI922_580 [Bacteroidota bacterium]|jgi:hypothetical protein
MLKKYALLFIIPISLIITSSCSNLTKEQTKYAGEWTFCYMHDFNKPPFWSNPQKNKFKLNEDGTWSFGESSGTWGGGESFPGAVMVEIDLHFGEWKVSSQYSHQITGVEGKIVTIDGIKCLRISLLYTYEGWGTVEDPTNGVSAVSDKQYSESVEYYFTKNSSDGKKVIQFFEEEQLKSTLEDVTEDLENLSGDDYLSWEYFVDNYVPKEKEAEIKKSLEYANKKGLATPKHKKLYKLLKGDLTIDQLKIEETKVEDSTLITE